MPDLAQLVGAGVSFRYRRSDPLVVREATIRLAQGEIVGLRGPSGCGKTTLGRLLAGFLVPDGGTVTVDGVALPSRGISPVQLVLQHPELAVNPRWRLGRILAEAGVPDQSLLDELSIARGWLDRYPNELSGGELQRIAVARALLAKPKFVIADEISAMLDPLTQAQLWQVLVRRVRAGEIGILAISHDGALLGVVADRCVEAAVWGMPREKSWSSRTCEPAQLQLTDGKVSSPPRPLSPSNHAIARAGSRLPLSWPASSLRM